MNSRKLWSLRFNCSDLVLELLEKGGLHKKIDLRRYDELSIVIWGIIFGQLTLTSFRLHPFSVEKWSDTFCRGLPYRGNHFSFYYDGIRILTPSFITFFLFFAYAILSFWRSGVPIYHFRKQIFFDSSKTTLFGALWLILSSSNIIKWRSLPTFLQIFKKIFVQIGSDIDDYLLRLLQRLQNTIMSGSLAYLTKPNTGGTLIRRAPDKPFENVSSVHNTLFLAWLLTILPIAVTAFSSSYLYNTTTTPQHVFNIATRVRNELKYNTESSAKLSNLQFKLWKNYLWRNKTKILGFAAAGALIGLSMFKKQGKVTPHGTERNVQRIVI